MPYTVIRPFKDMRDTEQHEYQIDDAFPRKGYEPDQEFVQGLLTGFNSAGSIFITDEVVKKVTEEVEEATEEKPKRKKATKKEEE